MAAAANKVAENLIQESKNKDFDIRKYARKGEYNLTSARLNGVILGEKGASLKIMSGVFRRSIFAIMKNGEILWVKGYALSEYHIKLILEKLCQKGKISEDELNFTKKQIHYVFSREETGKPYANPSRDIINKIYEKAGLDVNGFHIIRHTVGTTLAENGASEFEIQTFLHHEDYRTSRKYTHTKPKMLKNADNIIRDFLK